MIGLRKSSPWIQLGMFRLPLLCKYDRYYGDKGFHQDKSGLCMSICQGMIEMLEDVQLMLSIHCTPCIVIPVAEMVDPTELSVDQFMLDC